MRFYLIFILFLNPQFLFSQSILSYLEAMIDSISKIKTLEYDFYSKELIGNKLYLTNSKVKFQKEPFSLYNYIVSPNKGVELLYTKIDPRIELGDGNKS